MIVLTQTRYFTIYWNENLSFLKYWNNQYLVSDIVVLFCLLAFTCIVCRRLQTWISHTQFNVLSVTVTEYTDCGVHWLCKLITFLFHFVTHIMLEENGRNDLISVSAK